MVDLEHLLKGLQATFVGPVSEREPVLSVHFSDNLLLSYPEEAGQKIRAVVGTEKVRILKLGSAYNGWAILPYLIQKLILDGPKRKRDCSVAEALDYMLELAWERDAPLHSLRIYPTVYFGGRKGFSIVGDTSEPNNEIRENYMRMDLVPLN